MKKLSYLYEIPAFYTAVYLINLLLFSEKPGFIGEAFHPYWIGVGLFGFRYGVFAGFFAGLISAVSYVAQAWFYSERYLFEDIPFYILPSAFVLVGVLIGQGVQRYRIRIEQLERHQRSLEEQNGVQAEEIRTLAEIKGGLEKKIVTQMSTIITLYEGARRLESTRQEELLEAILDFVTKTLAVDEGAIYLREGKLGWRLWRSKGWPDYVKRPDYFEANQGLIGMAGSQKRLLTIRDFIGPSGQVTMAPNLLGDCLMAGPLRSGGDGEVLGVFAVQRMPMLSFNSSTTTLLQFLLNWASRSLGRASYINELQANEVIDPEYQVYSYSYFLNRAEQELARSQTYYLPLAIGLAKLEGLSGLSQRLQSYLLTVTSELLKGGVRNIDVVARYNEADVPFSLLLITASDKQVAGLKTKILQNFSKLIEDNTDERIRQVRLKIGVAHFSPQAAKLDHLLNGAKLHLH